MRWALLAVVLFAACDDQADPTAEPEGPVAPGSEAPGTEAPGTEPPPVACLPARSAWESTHRAQVADRCGTCHGEVPSFGAPSTLLDYDALVAGAEGNRLVDQLAVRIKAGTMPPAAQPQLAQTDRAALVEWATCGAETAPVPPNPADPGSNRPVLKDPGAPTDGMPFFDLVAPEFAVSTQWSDHYECFSFQAPVNEERFIRRIETIVDDARVLHHTVLIPESSRGPGEHGPCESDNPLNLIYGWAPGQGALQFAEGGLRLAPGQRMTLQVHYNNRARHPNVRDSSGVRIYHTAPEGPEVGMLALGPLDFEVAPQSRGDAVGWCRLPRSVQLLASFPHMHETGAAFDQVVQRLDGTSESVIRLDTWDFQSQYIYDTPMALEAGDLIRTTCTYANQSDRPIGFGANTDDEMCFNFAYITPPLGTSLNFCNTGAPPPEVPPYVPGECAPAGAAEATVAQTRAELRIGSPAAAEGGALVDGLWGLKGAAIYLPSLRLGPITVDAESTVVTGQGLLGLAEGMVNLDVQVALHLVTSASDFDESVAISLGAQVATAPANPVYLQLEPVCGNADLAQNVQFTGTSERLTLFVRVPVGPVSLPVELWFEPLP